MQQLSSPTPSRISKGKGRRTANMAGIEEAIQRMFIIRHGERLDKVDYEWVRRAERPYDPPLTEDGVRESH